MGQFLDPFTSTGESRLQYHPPTIGSGWNKANAADDDLWVNAGVGYIARAADATSSIQVYSSVYYTGGELDSPFYTLETNLRLTPVHQHASGDERWNVVLSVREGDIKVQFLFRWIDGGAHTVTVSIQYLYTAPNVFQATTLAFDLDISTWGDWATASVDVSRFYPGQTDQNGDPLNEITVELGSQSWTATINSAAYRAARTKAGIYAGIQSFLLQRIEFDQFWISDDQTPTTTAARKEADTDFDWVIGLQFFDEFDGTAGQVLQGHTPDVGTSWLKVDVGPDAALAATAGGVVAVPDGDGSPVWYDAHDTTGFFYKASADVTLYLSTLTTSVPTKSVTYILYGRGGDLALEVIHYTDSSGLVALTSILLRFLTSAGGYGRKTIVTGTGINSTDLQHLSLDLESFYPGVDGLETITVEALGTSYAVDMSDVSVSLGSGGKAGIAMTHGGALASGNYVDNFAVTEEATLRIFADKGLTWDVNARGWADKGLTWDVERKYGDQGLTWDVRNFLGQDLTWDVEARNTASFALTWDVDRRSTDQDCDWDVGGLADYFLEWDVNQRPSLSQELTWNTRPRTQKDQDLTWDTIADRDFMDFPMAWNVDCLPPLVLVEVDEGIPRSVEITRSCEMTG